MNGHALRGYGPRVFVSYSFKDKELAERIENALSGRGFQIRRENENSLTGQKLTEAIPKRIGEAEVLIQIRTKSSNLSEWIAREFSYAVTLKNKGQQLIILPLVFDKSNIPDDVKEWWFMDLADSGLTEIALEEIERVCLSSVCLLRLSEDDPFSISKTDLENLLQNVQTASKRVVFDSDGRLFQWVNDTLNYAQTMDTHFRAHFIAQENRRYERLTRRYKIIDEVIRKLALEVMKCMEGYTNEPVVRGLKAVHYFCRIILGDDVVTAAEMAPPDHHALRSAYKNLVEAAANSNTRNTSRGYLNSGLYAWVFGVDGGRDAIAEMGLDAPGFRGVPVNIPRDVFGEMADTYTRYRYSFDPKGELLTGTYVDYVLPQIGVHAAYNLTDLSTVQEDLEKMYAWQLDQYTSMGLR